jgi:hypothetical protein
MQSFSRYLLSRPKLVAISLCLLMLIVLRDAQGG